MKIVNIYHKLATQFLDILFPKVCIECGKYGGDVCINCISKIEKLIKLRPENTRYKKKLQDIQNLNIRKKIPEYENKLKSSNLNEDERV